MNHNYYVDDSKVYNRDTIFEKYLKVCSFAMLTLIAFESQFWHQFFFSLLSKSCQGLRLIAFHCLPFFKSRARLFQTGFNQNCPQIQFYHATSPCKGLSAKSYCKSATHAVILTEVLNSLMADWSITDRSIKFLYCKTECIQYLF